MTENLRAVLLFVGGVFLFAFVIAGIQSLGTVDNSEFNEWASKCYAQDGIVAVTHIQDDGREWYECFVDGKEVQIP